MASYLTLIGTDPVNVAESKPDVGQLIDSTKYDNYFLDWKIYSPSAYRVLIPAGAYDLRVSAYASQSAYVGYVARVDGEPSWDYSEVYGCSREEWNAAPWKPDNKGTVVKAELDDWQVQKQDGTAGIIQSNAGESNTIAVPHWLYLLPIASTGTIHMLQISLKVLKSLWKGWTWNRQNAIVRTYPHGGKFVTRSGGQVLPPNPFDKPVVELFDDLSIVVQEVTYRGDVVKGPWTLQYEKGMNGWRLKT